MSYRNGVLTAAAIVLLFGLAVRPEQAPSQPSEEQPSEAPTSVAPSEPSFVPGQLLVKTKEGVTPEATEEINRKHKARTKERIRHTRVKVVDLPEDLPVREAVEIYEASPDIEYAEPDYRIYPTQSSSPPNDTDYPRLYGLNNSGQSGGTADADVDAPEAWKTTTGDAGTVVAVIDSGVDINHPDLKNNIWTNPGETAGNGIDEDKNGYVDDVNGFDFANNDASIFDAAGEDSHGTHVAGTIAAQGNNGIGVTGVNWRAKIMPLKFIGSSGSGSISDAVEAINYAVARGAKISNNSWGGAGYSQTLLDAINRADAAGHLVVAAAGNGGSDGVGDNNDSAAYYPSGYGSSNIISVAATDNKDNLASFSNYGASSVDLAAPGVGILSTLPGNTYGAYNGTSMATPHVSGVAALLKSKNPSADDATLKAEILKAVDAKPSLSGKTASGGRLNATQTLGVKSAELGFTASPLAVDFGGGTLLSGRLTSSGAPLSGKKVILEQRPAGTSVFLPVPNGERTTDADGNFSLAGVTPATGTDYQARFAGESSSGLPPSTSAARRVDVKALVSLSTDTTNLKLGQSRTISGSVSPAHTGSVMLTIKLNGAPLTTQTVPLTSTGYSFSYKPKKAGTYAVSASWVGDIDHLGNTSVERSFKVVK